MKIKFLFISMLIFIITINSVNVSATMLTKDKEIENFVDLCIGEDIIPKKDRTFVIKLCKQILNKVDTKTKKKLNKMKSKIDGNYLAEGKLCYDCFDGIGTLRQYLYFDGYQLNIVHIIGDDSEGTTIKELIDNTNFKIKENLSSPSYINVDKDKTIIKDCDTRWITKDNSNYIINIYADKKGYLKDSTFSFSFVPDPYKKNDYCYEMFDSNIYGDYENDCMSTESITVTGKNDYVLKESFSLKNAPSYDNFEKEFMKKISGKSKPKIQKYYTDNEALISVILQWNDYSYKMQVEDTYFDKYQNYYYQKYSSKQYLWDVLSKLQGYFYFRGDHSFPCDFVITYHYDIKTRKPIAITYSTSVYKDW